MRKLKNKKVSDLTRDLIVLRQSYNLNAERLVELKNESWAKLTADDKAKHIALVQKLKLSQQKLSESIKWCKNLITHYQRVQLPHREEPHREEPVSTQFYVGDRFKFGLVELECAPGNGCEGCYFIGNQICTSKRISDALGPCSVKYGRVGGVDVVFRKVTK